MNTSYVLRNPVLKPGFQYAKVISVQEEKSGIGRPSLMIGLKIVPCNLCYRENWNQEVFVVIQNSPKADKIWDMFNESFGINSSCQEAIGRFGCIGVYLKEYNKAHFSQVHFVKPNLVHLNVVRSLINEEDEIPWDVDRSLIPKDNRKGAL